MTVIGFNIVHHDQLHDCGPLAPADLVRQSYNLDMAEEKGRKGLSRTEAERRYTQAKPEVRTLSELSEKYRMGETERQPPETLYTGTSLEYARQMIQKHGVFCHNTGPVFYSENFGGVAAPAVARVSQRSFSDTPIVLIGYSSPRCKCPLE